MNNPCIDLSSNRSASLVTPESIVYRPEAAFRPRLGIQKLLSRTAIRTAGRICNS
jgi:hypothetical protein